MKTTKGLLLLITIISYSLFISPSLGLAENLRIGYIGALTGVAAAIGTEIAKVLEVSIDEINQADGILVVDTLDCNNEIVKISQLHTCLATRTASIGETF